MSECENVDILRVHCYWFHWLFLSFVLNILRMNTLIIWYFDTLNTLTWSFKLRYAEASNSFERIQKLMDLVSEVLWWVWWVDFRWLQIYQVVQRFLELLPVLSKFFLSLSASEQKKESDTNAQISGFSCFTSLYEFRYLRNQNLWRISKIFFQT